MTTLNQPTETAPAYAALYRTTAPGNPVLLRIATSDTGSNFLDIEIRELLPLVADYAGPNGIRILQTLISNPALVE